MRARAILIVAMLFVALPHGAAGQGGALPEECSATTAGATCTWTFDTRDTPGAG